MITKLCKDCGLTKDFKEFYRDSTHRDGLSTHCKICKGARIKEYDKRYTYLRKVASLKRQYNLPYSEYLSMLAKQNNVCAICEKPECYKKALAVDHCHKTGKIRGLLCGKCNKGIGLLQDDIEILQKSINYLK